MGIFSEYLRSIKGTPLHSHAPLKPMLKVGFSKNRINKNACALFDFLNIKRKLIIRALIICHRNYVLSGENFRYLG